MVIYKKNCPLLFLISIFSRSRAKPWIKIQAQEANLSMLNNLKDIDKDEIRVSKQGMGLRLVNMKGFPCSLSEPDTCGNLSA